MRILSLTTIYPNEQNAAEGRSVAFLDAALAGQGYFGTTLVLKPYVPYWLAARAARWRHLAVRDRVQDDPHSSGGGGRVFFTHYLHVPTRFSTTLCVRAMAARAIQLIERHKIEFDVVHAETIYPAGPAAQIVARRFGVPFIVTLRDDLGHLDDMYKRRADARGLFEAMFREVAAIFAIGPAVYRELPRFLPRENPPPFVLAPNGVDVRGLTAMIQTFIPPGEHPWGRIVGVGNLYRYKGFHETLNALKQLDERGVKGWSFVIVGDGPYRGELKEMAASLGLADRVTLCGKLPHKEAVRAIYEADIFCLPSWAEAFGNVYAEAALCGRAAIGCFGYGAELMIADKKTGLLVATKDVPALANALEFLLKHPNDAQQMGARARERVQGMTWDATAVQYAEVLARISVKAQ